MGSIDQLKQNILQQKKQFEEKLKTDAPENIDILTPAVNRLNSLGGNSSTSSSLSSVQNIKDYAKKSFANSVVSNQITPGMHIDPIPTTALNFSTFYTKHAYDRLGFNPYNNNYEKYQKNTTAFEKLLDAQTGFNMLVSNSFNFFGLGVDNETISAVKNHELGSQIGTPIGDPHNLYNWALTQYTQAGFTVGMMAGIVAEDLALGALEIATGGFSTGLTIAQNTKRAISFTEHLNRLKKTSRLFKLKDISKGRSFFETIKTVGKKVPEFVAPNSTEFYRKLIKNYDTPTGVNLLAAGAEGFGAFWRDYQEIKMATSEAYLEGSMSSKDLMEQYVDEYIKKNGKAPEGEDLKMIQEAVREHAKGVVNTNLGLIYTTNKFGFEGLFNRYTRAKGLNTLLNNKYGKVFKEKGLKPKLEFVKKDFFGLKDLKFRLRKDNLKYLVPEIVNFTAMGTTEGFQEVAQEIIQEKAKFDAQDDFQKNIDGNFFLNYSKATEKVLSNNAGELFLSGFAMGMFAKPYSFAAQKTSEGIDFISDISKNGYKNRKELKQEQIKKFEDLVESLNKDYENTWDYEKSILKLVELKRNSELKRKMDQAANADDKKQFIDYRDELAFNTILKHVNNGTEDLFVEQLDSMSQMTDNELKEAFSEQIKNDDDLKDFREKIDFVKNEISHIKSMKEKVDEEFVNPYEPYLDVSNENYEKYGFKTDPRVYYTNYEKAKRDFLFLQYSAKRTVERMAELDKAILNDISDVDSKINTSDITSLYSIEGIQSKIESLSTEIEALESLDNLSAEDKKRLSKNKEQVEILKELEDFFMELSMLEFNKREVPEKVKNIYFEEEDQQQRKGLEKLNLKVKDKIDKNKFEFLINELLGKDVLYKDNKGTLVKYNKEKNKVLIEVNKKGKKKKIWVKIDNVRFNKSDINESVSNTLNEESFEKANELLSKYLNAVSSKPLAKTVTDNIISKFKDLYDILNDNKNISNTIETLINPDSFEKLFNAHLESSKILHEKRKEIIKDGIESVIKSKDKNELIQSLLNINLSFLEEDWEIFFKNEDDLKDAIDTLSGTPVENIKKKLFDNLELTLYNTKTYEKASEEEVDQAVNEILEYLENKFDLSPDEAKTKTTKKTKTKYSINEPIPENATYDELPESLQEEIEKEYKRINEKLIKKAPENAYDTLEDYLNSLRGKGFIKEVIKQHNKQFAKSQKTTQDSQDSQDKFDEDENEVTIVDSSIEKILEPYKKTLKEEGDLLIAIPANKTLSEIEKIFIKKGLLKQGETLDDRFIGKFIETPESDLSLVYFGFASVNEIEIPSLVAEQMKLPKKQTGKFKIPVKINNDTYYTDSKHTAAWLQGKGKLFVFKAKYKGAIDVNLELLEKIDEFEKQAIFKIQSVGSLDELEKLMEDIDQGYVEFVKQGSLVPNMEKINKIKNIKEFELKKQEELENKKKAKLAQIKSIYNIGDFVKQSSSKSKSTYYIIKDISENGVIVDQYSTEKGLIKSEIRLTLQKFDEEFHKLSKKPTMKNKPTVDSSSKKDAKEMLPDNLEKFVEDNSENLESELDDVDDNEDISDLFC